MKDGIYKIIIIILLSAFITIMFSNKDDEITKITTDYIITFDCNNKAKITYQLELIDLDLGTLKNFIKQDTGYDSCNIILIYKI